MVKAVYMISVKRMSILFSVAYGWLLFKESQIGNRMVFDHVGSSYRRPWHVYFFTLFKYDVQWVLLGGLGLWKAWRVAELRSRLKYAAESAAERSFWLLMADQTLFREWIGVDSVHLSLLPESIPVTAAAEAIAAGALLVELAEATRAYKTQNGYSVKMPLASLRISGSSSQLKSIELIAEDLKSFGQIAELTTTSNNMTNGNQPLLAPFSEQPLPPPPPLAAAG